MPPKKKVEAPPEEVVDTSISMRRLQVQFAEAEEAQETAVEVMHEVVQRAADLMASNYLDRLAIPYTIQDVAKEILDLMQFMFVGRDAGDAEDAEATASWAPDEEPASVPADSWARGVVPTRRRAPLPDPTPPMSTTALMSPRRRRTPPSDVKVDGLSSNQYASFRTVRPTARGLNTSVVLRPEQLPEVEEEPVHPSVDESQRALRQAALEQQRRTEIQERLELQMKTLRQAGKDFMVDTVAGKIIPVQPVDVKRLPQRTLDIKVRIEDDEVEGEAPREDARRKMQPGIFVRRDKPKKRREPRIPPGTYLQPEDSAGPMVEEFRPAGGVTLREGDRIQRTDLKAPKDRPSKADFRKEQEAIGMNVEYILAQEEMKRTLEQAKKTLATTASVSTTSSPQPSSPSRAGRDDGRKPEAVYRPQEVALRPGNQKDSKASGNRYPRRKGEPARPAVEGVLSPERRHWTANSFTATGSPATSPHLPELQISMVRSEPPAQELAHALH
eukprot:GGOE01036899.1.p1 GENE.GGOE01036899.1~~GGOE01036899.1.p1  ORF type:complete len:501 (+),score=132.08 GGOE01036899.1:109-1611(+)